jgi:hypothetical protein
MPEDALQQPTAVGVRGLDNEGDTWGLGEDCRHIAVVSREQPAHLRQGVSTVIAITNAAVLSFPLTRSIAVTDRFCSGVIRR